MPHFALGYSYAVAAGIPKSVMGIVPAFAKGDTGDKLIVATVITCLKRLLTPQMSKGIYGGNAMEKQGRTEAECRQELSASQYIGESRYNQ